MIPGGRSRTVRCDRRTPHATHTYVATPRSGIDLTCPGLATNRSVAQLLADQPALDGVGVGAVLHVLAVMAA